MNTAPLFECEIESIPEFDHDIAEAFELVRKHLQKAEQLMETLLRLIAEERRACAKCNAELFFVRHRPKKAGERGALAPYTIDGNNHFVNCPQAEHFKRKAAR